MATLDEVLKAASESGPDLMIRILGDDELRGFVYGCSYGLGVLSLAEGTIEQRRETLEEFRELLLGELRRRALKER